MRYRPQSGSRYARVAGTVVIAGLLALVSVPALAEPDESPFTALQGSWAGTGAITMLNGTKERIRCNAAHHLGASSSEIQLELTCASDSYKFNLQSQVTNSGGAISGNWFETTRATGGAITGRIAGSAINVRAEGQTFNAILSITTKADRQAISIQSPGSEMSDVAITLTRKSR
jgi:hypothetical protein